MEQKVLQKDYIADRLAEEAKLGNAGIFVEDPPESTVNLILAEKAIY